MKYVRARSIAQAGVLTTDSSSKWDYKLEHGFMMFSVFCHKRYIKQTLPSAVPEERVAMEKERKAISSSTTEQDNTDNV